MNAPKVVFTIVQISTSVLIVSSLLSYAELPPIPGMPHRFWGTVKYSDGTNLPDGSIVEAVVDNETYSTKVVNGTYGYYTPFYVEDPYDDNEGKTIYFYVNGINTTQTAIFRELGATELNLVVPVEEKENETFPSMNGNGNENLLPPVADAGGPYIGFVNETVIFDASNSYDPDGTIESYTWNFGDNSTGSGVFPSHIYTKEGTYRISLMVEDNDGLIDIDETTVTIMFDSDNDGWGDQEEEQYGTDPHNATSYPEDTDSDRLPDSVDPDDDNDGLSDEIENLINTDPKTKNFNIELDINDKVVYLIDIDNDTLFDILYSPYHNVKVNVSVDKDGRYKLDLDGDGSVDFFYDPYTGSVVPKEKRTPCCPPYYILTIIGILFVLVVIAVLFYRKRLGGREK